MGLWEELHVGMISAWMGKGDIPQRAYWEPQAPFLPEFVRETSHIKFTGHVVLGRSFRWAPFLPGFVRETSHIKCTGHGFFGRSFP